MMMLAAGLQNVYFSLFCVAKKIVKKLPSSSSSSLPSHRGDHTDEEASEKKWVSFEYLVQQHHNKSQ